MYTESLIGRDPVTKSRWEARLSPDAVSVLLIVLFWAAAIVLVNPLGDFPAVDDWAYATSVRALVERGEIIFSDWTAANLISQVFWGALFALPFGTTYTALRFSTLALALAGSIALFRILRVSDCPTPMAFLGALVILFNPLYCVLSVTFMTDVPYAAMQTIAMLPLLAGLRAHSRRQLGLGWAIAVAALLCRQVGMAIPLGYGSARIFQTGFNWKTVLPAVAPFAAFVAAQVLYQIWLEHSGLAPADFGRQIGFMAGNIASSSPMKLTSDLFRFAENCFYYLGIFLLPLTIIAVTLLTRTFSRRYALGLWFGIFLVTFLIALFGPVMPVWANNTILRWSLGSDVMGVPPPTAFWTGVTVLSAFGGIMLLLTLAIAARALWWGIANRQAYILPQLFAAVTAAALLGAIALLPEDTQFDRYVIPVIPCLVIVICAPLRKEMLRGFPPTAIFASTICLFAIATYSILGTHDYLAEKRVLWTVLQDLIQKGGVPPENIDAGWVYNAPTSFGIYGDANNIESWFKTQEYIVVSSQWSGLESAQGYDVLQDHAVYRWAPWSSTPGSILVLYRTGAVR